MNDRDYYDSLPKKRMAVGAIFLNDTSEILIVKPTYKERWSIPGGVVDENESLLDACIREIREELDLSITKFTLLGVDYISPQISEYTNRSENIQFIFHGGILREKEIEKIKIPKEELSEFMFKKEEDAVALLGKNLSKRIPPCIEALKIGTAVYLENGEVLT